MNPGTNNRYFRQMIIDGWGEQAQDILAESSVAIIGAGGLGSTASMYLAAAGVGRLVICDFDAVEVSNLNRQLLHAETSIGMMKTESARKTLQAINSRVETAVVTERITDDTIAEAAEGCTVLVDCLDNLKTRYVLNRYSVASGKPMVHAGLHGMNGQITVFQPGMGPCLACVFPEIDDDPGRGPIPVVGAAVGVISSMQALETLKLLTGLGKPLNGRMLIYNGLEATFDSVALTQDPGCPVCGGRDRN